MKIIYKFFIRLVNRSHRLQRWLWYWKFFQMNAKAYDKMKTTHQAAAYLVPQGNNADDTYAIACIMAGITLPKDSGVTWTRVTEEYNVKTDLYWYKVLENGEIAKVEVSIG